MENRRVVITGMGVVAPNGTGIDAFWDSWVHGRSGVRRITHFDASSYPCQVAAEVPDFNPLDYMDYKTAKRLARFAQFALAASKMAVDDSKIDLHSIDPYRIGVMIGTGSGLGLSISNQIIQDHKGYINVESQLHKGTSFFINLPVNQEHPKRRKDDL